MWRCVASSRGRQPLLLLAASSSRGGGGAFSPLAKCLNSSITGARRPLSPNDSSPPPPARLNETPPPRRLSRKSPAATLSQRPSARLYIESPVSFRNCGSPGGRGLWPSLQRTMPLLPPLASANLPTLTSPHSLLQSHHVGNTFPQLGGASHQCRGIFTHEYLGIDTFTQSKNAHKLQMRNEDAFKKTVAENFRSNGLKQLFTEDIEKLVDVTETEEDLQLLADILRAYLSTDSRAFTSFSTVLNWYFLLCKSLNQVSSGRSMWSDEAVRRSGIMESSRKLRLRYYMLLYDNALYTEVVAELSQSVAQPTTSSLADVDELTVLMAALYKVGTAEAFATATHALHKSGILLEQGGVRAIYVYSLFAYRLAEFGNAYDTLTTKRNRGRSHKLCTNLKLAVLVAVGRVEEALVVIRSELLPVDGDDERKWRKRVICFETMKDLTAATKAECREDLTRELAGLFKVLDATATLSEQTLEEMVFEPIGGGERRAKPDAEGRKSRRHERRREDATEVKTTKSFRDYV